MLSTIYGAEWEILWWCAVKKLLTHSLCLSDCLIVSGSVSLSLSLSLSLSSPNGRRLQSDKWGDWPNSEKYVKAAFPHRRLFA